RLTRAKIIGWLWREEVKGFSIRNLKFGRAISVPKESLRPFSELIEVFQSENSRIRPKLP
ncbi:MAG: hypothetical protein NZ931_02675, partial [Aigarchaeota archaeon]|nr:hypothetical protein [Aigarchaeota archaeon]